MPPRPLARHSGPLGKRISGANVALVLLELHFSDLATHLTLSQRVECSVGRRLLRARRGPREPARVSDCDKAPTVPSPAWAWLWEHRKRKRETRRHELGPQQLSHELFCALFPIGPIGGHGKDIGIHGVGEFVDLR